MSKKAVLILTMVAFVLSVTAQEVHIVNFSRLKKSALMKMKVKKEKKQAVLVLTTDEKGFTFKADGENAKKENVEAEEGDGMLTLKLPHKTQFVTVSHPEYGQETWRVPEGNLRKKKCYHAYLQTYSPDKEYKLEKQWVIFQVFPKNAILRVDSTMTLVRDGKAQFHLTVGKHTYSVESPFHEPEEGTLDLTEYQKMHKNVYLQPIYSYVTVKTPQPEYEIYVDNHLIGKKEAVSGHLYEGSHRLSVFADSLCYYDASFTIGKAEKKVVTLTASDLSRQPWREQTKLASIAVLKDTARKDSTASLQASASSPASIRKISAPVTIKAPDEDTEILLNREPVGRGHWEGTLEEGYYIINSRKDGIESATQSLWVDDEFPKDINIGVPQAYRGYLNIHSNVMGADVYLNDSLIGTTPCTIGDLPAGRTYVVRLEAPTYKPVERKTLVLGNNMVDVEIIMDRRKE